MKQLIARLRELEAAALVGDPKLLGETTASMEFIDLLVDNSAQLLDRLEKLEAVAEAAELMTYTATDTSCRVYEVHADDRIRLEDALAALGDK